MSLSIRYGIVHADIFSHKSYVLLRGLCGYRMAGCLACNPLEQGTRQPQRLGPPDDRRTGRSTLDCLLSCLRSVTPYRCSCAGQGHALVMRQVPLFGSRCVRPLLIVLDGGSVWMLRSLARPQISSLLSSGSLSARTAPMLAPPLLTISDVPTLSAYLSWPKGIARSAARSLSRTLSQHVAWGCISQCRITKHRITVHKASSNCFALHRLGSSCCPPSRICVSLIAGYVAYWVRRITPASPSPVRHKSPPFLSFHLSPFATLYPKSSSIRTLIRLLLSLDLHYTGVPVTRDSPWVLCGRLNK